MQATVSTWDGADVYIFGGTSHIDGPFDTIFKYTPSTGEVSSMSAVLPDPVCDFSAVWTGHYEYIFGGYVAPLHTSDKIVRYEPSTDTIVVMGAKLPTYAFPIYSMAAVWDGNYAYLFGGYDGYSYFDQILRYDPINDQITTMSAKLPVGTKWMSAVWSGTYAYIFGGRTPYGASDQIVRYDSIHDSVAVMTAKLPVGILVTSAVWAGSCAYIFGGSDINNQVQSSILKYDPASDIVTAVDNLPSPRRFTSAVWAGNGAYIFGGEDSNRIDLDEIVWFSDHDVHMDIDPDTLNLRSKGEWITAYIELPEGFDLENIDISSLHLNGTVPAEALPTCVGDYDNDGVADLMVKFDRTAVADYIRANVAFTDTFMTITLVLTGNLVGGAPFQGTDAIRIIVPKTEILPD
jgi:N-acetylneuraminic acid mutarotase